MQIVYISMSLQRIIIIQSFYTLISLCVCVGGGVGGMGTFKQGHMFEQWGQFHHAEYDMYIINVIKTSDNR